MSWVRAYYFYPLPLDGIEVELKGGEICRSPAPHLGPDLPHPRRPLSLRCDSLATRWLKLLPSAKVSA